MIPVLLGSKRIPDKNLILVDGRVLCSYTIEACKESGAFTEVCLNSEDEVFESVAEKEIAKFHRRPAEWGGRACRQKTKSRDCAGGRCVINEHYLYNFMTAGPQADYVCQVNATSPLLKPETMARFVGEMVEKGHDSYFAVNTIKAESFFNGRPVSFSPTKKIPSNDIPPIYSICWAIAGWKVKSFLETYDRDDPAEEGPVFAANRGFYPIDEREALDIDQWSTLDLVERYLIGRRTHEKREWKYLDGRTVVQ